MKELKIGEIGVIDGIKVQCCIDDFADCDKCAFFGTDCGLKLCESAVRSDHTDVYFKKIEE